MNDEPSAADRLARNRYFTMTLARIAGAAGAVFGIVLLARATTIDAQVIGVGIVVSALVVMALVPRSLARRWRTPPQP